MNCDDPTPRVGFAQLKNMIGRRVLFVGRVESMDGGVARLAAPDGSKVAVQAPGMYETPFVEVTGTVVDPQTIRQEAHVAFGENFGASPGAGRVRVGVPGPGQRYRVDAHAPAHAAPQAPCAHAPHSPPSPRRRADMNTYNELLKLANGPQAALFYRA